MIHHPKLGNDFADELPMAEKSYDRTLRNHDADRLGYGAHVGSRNVTAPETHRYLHLCGPGVEVAARGKHNSIVADDEGTVQLSQFLNGSAEIEISDLAQRHRMTQQRVQNQRSGPGEHGVLVSQSEQRSNASSFSTLASDFNCKLDQGL